MSTKIGNIAIEVSDLERSERFYVGVLGLEVASRIDTPDVREVIVGAPGEGSQLMLAKHTVPDGPVRPEGGIWKVFIHTDDATAAYERAVAGGADPVAEPKHLEKFRVTIALVRDPDGYLIELGQIHPR
ncbi:MAG TPA: VOC family protein [Acidimicrobiales bacterium]|nr:VOC family protein [Acidimicrobiales bacterium]